MPLPLIIPIVLIAGGLAAVVGAFIFSYKGKKIAILGAKSTGKTTLYNFLTEDDRKGGTGIENTKSNNFKLNDAKLKLKKFKDIAGSEDFVFLWKKLIEKSDYTFYMINGYKVLNNDFEYLKTVRTHLSTIDRHCSSFDKQNENFLIIVFLDMVNGFFSNRNHFEEEIRKKLVNHYPTNYCVFFGSLATDDYKKELTTNLLKTMNAL